MMELFQLQNGQQVTLMRGKEPIPENLADRAEAATAIFIGKSPHSDNALVIFVVGEVAIKVEVGWEEAIFYYGTVTGSAAPLRKE
jgi:hypothetical protein